jgi:hypothetical protein
LPGEAQAGKRSENPCGKGGTIGVYCTSRVVLTHHHLQSPFTQCCEHDICNIRWSNIRHEFDKLALREEDKGVAIEQIQEVLENCFADIEERRGGLPLTSKQKEDDLKAATDAMVEKFNRRMEEQEGDKGEDELTAKQKERRRKKEEEEKRKKEGAKAKKKEDMKESEGKVDEEDEEVIKVRVNFKDFEKWYLEYFATEEYDEA